MKGRKLQRFIKKPFDHSRDPGPDNFGPYNWQIEFFNASERSRGIMAGNRCGKTQTAAIEVSIHATGLYPDWWEGRRFNHPVNIWTGCETNELSRDVVQQALLGEEDAHGTGWLPRDYIKGVKYRQAGVPDVVDIIKIHHVSGGVSIIKLKTYEQGRKKWQGTAKHIVWLDEEPDWDIFSEAKTRTLDTKGILFLTFTPLLGSTGVVEFLVSKESPAFMKNVTWAECPHLDEDAKDELRNTYQDWEIETREKGIPMMGSGAVFPIKDSDILIPPFEIPNHFYRICGIDFGIDHPAAAVWLAWDKDADILYVIDCYKKKGQTPIYHAGAIKKRVECPVAWPHDGMDRDKGTGRPLYKSYKLEGVRMIRRSARYEEDIGGPQGVEPAIVEILERMMTGRFKVFTTCNAWMEEKRMYHRKDGQGVAKKDDIMAATRIAVMDRRKAKPKTIMYIQQSSAQPILRGLHGR